MSGLSELIAKLEGLSGPDRELDWLLHSNVAQPWMKGSEHRRSLFVDVDGTPADDDEIDWSKDGLKWFRDSLPVYTGSIDAAVALVERKLPGWGYYLRSDKEGHGCGLVYPDAFRVTPCHCMGATPAIALCLALLRSLEGRDE